MRPLDHVRSVGGSPWPTVRLCQLPTATDPEPGSAQKTSCSEGEHTHPEHLVFWPTQGTGSVAVGGSWHSLTVGQGLWVPADTPHVIERTPASTLAAVHIHPLSWKGGGPGGAAGDGPLRRSANCSSI